MHTNIFRRKIYFLKKSFQGKYIFYYFMLALACVAVFTVIFSIMSSGTTSISYDNYNLRVGATPYILIKQMLISNWFFIIIGGFTVVIITMFLMHRIAGPLYRFNIILTKMTSGDFTERIVLRKHDEFKIIAEKFNEFNSSLSENIDSVKNLSRIIEENIKLLETRCGSDEAIKTITDSNSRILEVLNNFKTR